MGVLLLLDLSIVLLRVDLGRYEGQWANDKAQGKGKFVHGEKHGLSFILSLFVASLLHISLPVSLSSLPFPSRGPAFLCLF